MELLVWLRRQQLIVGAHSQSQGRSHATDLIAIRKELVRFVQGGLRWIDEAPRQAPTKCVGVGHLVGSDFCRSAGRYCYWCVCESTCLSCGPGGLPKNMSPLGVAFLIGIAPPPPCPIIPVYDATRASCTRTT